MRITSLVAIGFVAATSSCAAQSASIPLQFQGRWGSSLDRCNIPHEGALRIHRDRIDFYESRGKVLAVRSIGSLEIEIDLELSDADQTWRRTQRVALSRDQRTLTDTTNADPVHKFVRVRCSKERVVNVAQSPNNSLERSRER